MERAVLLCPVCAEPRSGRRCPRCGHDLLPRQRTGPSSPGDDAGGVPLRAGWVAIAQADPDYYEKATTTGDLEAPRVPFPRAWPARYFALNGERAWIGRRGRSRTHRPEIDLGGWPADPGVARLHALLLAVPTGGWVLMDPGSASGTTVNDDPTPVPVDALVPLAAGDRIHLGAWTTIVLQRSGADW
ncbi:hypothetical protein Raf01_83220 [Rugosimonospora africana]|uniref:FHA domain-containing protein n=1 Tax=Rugosimonospora africana TaxID=556532 RepID=A0A8J3R2G1_9ACTN|nr:hypothetical protein Raf01_83220 [Rugosimonospora africana]